MPPLIPLAFGLLAAVCFAAATVLQCVGVRRLRRHDDLDLRFVAGLVKQPLFCLGTLLDVGGFTATVIALGSLPLFLVQALGASSAGLTAVLACAVLGERLSRRCRAGVVLLMIGLTLLTPAAVPSDAHLFPLTHQLPLVACLPVLASAARRAAALGRAPAALGTLAGLALGAGSIGARGLPLDEGWFRLAVQPLTWAVAGFTVLGMVVFSAGLQRGSAVRVSATCMAAEVLVPALVGVVVLGDQARPGLAPIAALGFVITLGGALLASVERAAGRAGPANPAPAGSWRVVPSAAA